MACALTQSYNLDCRDSYGGLSQVFLIEFENATATATAGVVTTIAKVATKFFRKYNLVAYTGEATQEESNNRENGTSSVKQSVKFPINKMTVSVRNELLIVRKNRLKIVVVDENGIGWLYGEEKGLMLASANSTTGVKLEDRNGYELVFEGMSKETALQVDAATLLTLETPGA